MGTDIHGWLEAVGYSTFEGEVSLEPGETYEIASVGELGIHRNYALFSVMSDVRNGFYYEKPFIVMDEDYSEFSPRNEGILPIGVPLNSGYDVLYNSLNYYDFFHSFTTISIDEFMNYNFEDKYNTETIYGSLLDIFKSNNDMDHYLKIRSNSVVSTIHQDINGNWDFESDKNGKMVEDMYNTLYELYEKNNYQFEYDLRNGDISIDDLLREDYPSFYGELINLGDVGLSITESYSDIIGVERLDIIKNNINDAIKRFMEGNALETNSEHFHFRLNIYYDN